MGFPYLFELGSINTNVQATSWTVNDDGGADFSSIQAAIDSVSNSDTIFVWEGTYYEHLVVNKKLKIIGNGTENTTINGGGGDTLIEITIDGTEIYNLNLTNCWRGIYLNSVTSGLCILFLFSFK